MRQTTTKMAVSLVSLSLLFVMCLEVRGQSNPACNTTECELPNCLCPSIGIPKDLSPGAVPQMILFSFSGTVTAKHGDHIKEIFNRKKRNPNGNPIRATFFVSDDREKTDYCTVHNLWAYGHEMGSLSVNRRTPPSWWAKASIEDWAEEIDTQKEYIAGNASVPNDQIRGFRSPHLQTGGNDQYEFAVESGYIYDSSIVLPILEPRTWPYTMDYPTDYPCHTDPCPDEGFPGLWQIPIQPLKDRAGKPCVYLDNCMYKPRNAKEVRDMLWDEFSNSFTGNRAPMTINLLNYLDWFDENPWALEGINNFIGDVLRLGDDNIWFLTYQDMVGWMREPTVNYIKYFAPFQKTKQEKEECEERRSDLLFSGKGLLVFEILLCVVAFIWLYVKEQQ